MYKSPRSVLIAELCYFLTVMLGIVAGYVFWDRHIASKVSADAEFGVATTYPMLAMIVFAVVVVFLFTLRRILVKAGVLAKEESLRYLYSRSWYVKE
ncbi:MAG: hypothetical protein FWF95_00600 [Syntrophorhabdaceae bacterium]|nr:hypothetical protein [Syntrophorhabdaceae bacterium]